MPTTPDCDFLDTIVPILCIKSLKAKGVVLCAGLWHSWPQMELRESIRSILVLEVIVCCYWADRNEELRSDVAYVLDVILGKGH